MEERLITDLAGLAESPEMIKALQQRDEARISAVLIAERARREFDHLQVVDAAGDLIGATHHGHARDSGDPFQQLHDLGLLGVPTTKLVTIQTDWLLVAVRPIKSRTDLLGAASAGYLLDAAALSQLNFGRTDPVLMLTNKQGWVKVASGQSNDSHDSNGHANRLSAPASTDAAELWKGLDQEPDLRIEPGGGDIRFDRLELGGREYIAAHAPLTVGDHVAAGFGVALSTAATTGLRDRLVITNIIVVGLLTIFSIAIGYLFARRIADPISRLARGAREIGDGRLDAEIDVGSGGEVGSLAKSFNHMARNVRLSRDHLERQVEERTQSLSRSNERLESEIAERKRAEEVLRRSESVQRELADENEALAEIGRIIASSIDIDHVYERFAEQVRLLIPFDRIVISRVDLERSTFWNAYAMGNDIREWEASEPRPLAGTVLDTLVSTRSGALAVAGSVQEFVSRFPDQQAAAEAGLPSMLAVPLISRSDVIGVLVCRSREPNAYGDRHLHLAERVGAEIAGGRRECSALRASQEVGGGGAGGQGSRRGCYPRQE